MARLEVTTYICNVLNYLCIILSPADENVNKGIGIGNLIEDANTMFYVGTEVRMMYVVRSVKDTLGPAILSTIERLNYFRRS